MTFEVRACRRRGYRAELSSHLPNRVCYAPAIGDARTLRNLPQFRISGRDSLEGKVESGKSAQTEIVAPTLPLNSFPDVQFLIVVLFKETDLYEHLTKIFAGVRGVKVIMERRRGDRRQQRRDVAVERRERERRLHRGKVSALGYTAVRLPRS